MPKFRIHEALCVECLSIYTQYRSTQKYCSDKCRKKAIQNYHIRQRAKERSVVCPVCNNTFVTKISKKKYCSNTCYLANKTTQYIPKEEDKRICAHCGKAFSTAHYMQKYCSRTCYMKAHKERSIKEKEE